MSRTIKSVSEKNTKNEILAAYHELLSEASAGVTPLLNYHEEKAVVASAASQTVEKITAELSKLKPSFTQAVNELTDRLTEEAETLATIQKAIVISKKELEETQKIKMTAGLLYSLLETQKKQEDTFEKEMQEKKHIWAQEEKAHTEEITRIRIWEEEEYRYEKQLQKKRDADVKEDEQEVQEKLHTELADLRKKVVQIPTETDKLVKDAVTKALVEAKKDAEVTLNTVKQQATNDMSLAGLKIESLEVVNKAQSAEVVQLKRQLDEATRQVKDIAVSVIESKRQDVASPSLNK